MDLLYAVWGKKSKVGELAGMQKVFIKSARAVDDFQATALASVLLFVMGLEVQANTPKRSSI